MSNNRVDEKTRSRREGTSDIPLRIVATSPMPTKKKEHFKFSGKEETKLNRGEYKTFKFEPNTIEDVQKRQANSGRVQEEGR